MKWFIQILGAATHDSRPSVIVHFDSQRYLFNCGEGTQRLCNDQRIRLAKLKTMFISRLSWDNIGGLPGMLLTLADAGTKQLRICGPSGIVHAVASMRHFLYRPSFQVDLVELPTDYPEFKDENLTVTPILLHPTTQPPKSPRPKTSNSRKHSRSPSPQNETDRARKIDREILSTMFGKFPNEGEDACEAAKSGRAWFWRKERLLPISAAEGSMAYVCRGPNVPGKMDAGAAKKLGVKVGPDFGRLARGESVTLENGTVVHSHQCVGPTKPGAVFCIIDCPHPSYVHSVINAPGLNPKSLSPSSIVHILGKGVLDCKEYREWMGGFGTKTEHIVSSANHTADETILHCTAEINGLLNQIDGDIFPAPYSNYTPKQTVSDFKDLPAKTQPSRPQLIHHMEPKVHIDSSEVPKQYTPPSAQTHPVLLGCLDCLKQEMEESASTEDIVMEETDGDVVVVTLGTGSAIPSKYRNVSSTLLQFSSLAEPFNVVLDAGEGTTGQMFRHFGQPRFETEIMNIRIIFVSHLHADHHLGVVGIIKMRKKLFEDHPEITPPNLYILAPAQYIRALREYNDCEKFGIDATDVKTVCSEDVVWNEGKDTVILEGRFSGDCRPTPALVKAGQDATVLIHEATLEDDKNVEALEKKHCTTSEALGVARDMNAKNVLLTHFSQRYPKLPKLPEASATDTMRIGIAFDSMRVKVDDFWKLPRLMAPLRILWKEMEENEKENDEENDEAATESM
ncbi:Zinc phosphodiesterase ELAC protein 2 [Phlyctochytrium planicorne]|nr:Zinc phosphodiesterase ELAC protein 2 [Phlyctochytrium planicorne]